MRFRPDPELYPFTSQWLPLTDGTRIHYVDEGSGPVLLLLHGNPAWSFLYRKIIPRLSRGFRCIAPDLPGFGLSTARPGYGYTASEQSEAIVAFIDALDLQGAAVMMQDWGGPIGLGAALARPDRIDRLIIGNTFAGPFRRRGPRVFSAIMGGPAGRFAAWSFSGVVRWFFTVGVMKKLTRAEWAMYLAPFRQRDTRRPTAIFPRQLVGAGPFLSRIKAALPEIADKPALILWGDSDFAFKTVERDQFRAASPNHRDITLRNAGHFIQEDAPGPICEAIEAWYADDPVTPPPDTAATHSTNEEENHV
ncbi:MAG: alpha/beta fold hydrolase [Rhodobacteraceae bacterium]|nr:alpha/beta fold hydrolase [Alphaproteobacteria bacterium]NNK67400.1 alpha/beta fold hydrolase [Paracoccaceae bacterium]